MAPRPQQRPPSPKYDQDKHGHRQNTFGNYIIKPELTNEIECKKPSWEGTETVFRPYPSRSYETDGEFLPYRLDPGGKNHFGHWIRRYDCAWGVGNPASTFLLSNPDSDDHTFDPWNTPLGILYRAIERAVKEKKAAPHWYGLREGTKGKGKALKAPAETYLMQGALMVHKDKPQFGGGVPPGIAPNKPCVMMLSGGAGREMLKQLAEENEGYRGDPGDFEARFKNGDPVSLKSGRFIHWFQKGHDPRLRYQAHPTERGAPMPDVFSGQVVGGGLGGKANAAADEDDYGFDCFITKDIPGVGGAAINNTQMVYNQWRFWENILSFPTVAEQAKMLFKIFPVDACYYAFSDVNMDWIPEEAIKQMRAVHTAPVAVSPYQLGAPLVSSQPIYQPPQGAAYPPSGQYVPPPMAPTTAQVPQYQPPAPPSVPGYVPPNGAPGVPVNPFDGVPAAGGMDQVFGSNPDESVPSTDDATQTPNFGFTAPPPASGHFATPPVRATGAPPAPGVATAQAPPVAAPTTTTSETVAKLAAARALAKRQS